MVGAAVKRLLYAGALNRAEWLKFMGLFFNLDDSANTIFNQINSSYYTRSASYKASNAGKGNHTVAWIALYETAFQVSFADYKLEFVRDAGGNATNQTALAAMSNVTASEFSSSTLQFAWGPTDMGFANQTAAIAAFHRFLSNVGPFSTAVPPCCSVICAVLWGPLCKVLMCVQSRIQQHCFVKFLGSCLLTVVHAAMFPRSTSVIP